jgi:hypothetical protein
MEIFFLFRRLDPIMRAGFEGEDTQKNEPQLKRIVQQYLGLKYSEIHVKFFKTARYTYLCAITMFICGN